MMTAYQIPPAPCDGSYSAALAMSWGASPDLIFEEKINGLRLLLQIQPRGAVHNVLTGRRLQKATGKFTELQDQHPAIRDFRFDSELADTVIDGEWAEGVFWYFDLLVFKGRAWIEKPLRERREKLLKLSGQFPAWMRPVPCSSTAGDFLRNILARGGEGIIRKNLNETYGFAWSKARLEETHDVVILAVDPAHQRLRLGQYKNKKLVECGSVGNLTPAELLAAATQVGEVAEIICQQRDSAGRFQRAVFLRFRPDKAPEDCVIERDKTVRKTRSAASEKLPFETGQFGVQPI